MKVLSVKSCVSEEFGQNMECTCTVRVQSSREESTKYTSIRANCVHVCTLLHLSVSTSLVNYRVAWSDDLILRT